MRMYYLSKASSQTAQKRAVMHMDIIPDFSVVITIKHLVSDNCASLSAKSTFSNVLKTAITIAMTDN